MKILKNSTLPKNYQTAVLDEENTPLKLEIKNTTGLQKGEVWIQIKASPINPSDLAMLAGTYPHKKTYPFVPGLEAAGIVVASGGGFMANYLLGKNVACSAPETGDGTWAEYMKAPAGNCIPLIKSLSFEQAAGAIVNPMTALALIDRVKQSGKKSFVNTAAAGALGKMIIKLAANENLEPINIVHRKALVDELKSGGAKIVLDSSAPDFAETYQSQCKKLDARIILDAVGGEFSNTLILNAPTESILVAYASLSKDFLHINPAPIIRFGIKVEGFHLAKWASKQSKVKLLRTTRRAQKLIADGTLGSKIHKQFKLEDINDAVADYQNEMTRGKRQITF